MATSSASASDIRRKLIGEKRANMDAREWEERAILLSAHWQKFEAERAGLIAECKESGGHSWSPSSGYVQRCVWCGATTQPSVVADGD